MKLKSNVERKERKQRWKSSEKRDCQREAERPEKLNFQLLHATNTLTKFKLSFTASTAYAM